MKRFFSNASEQFKQCAKPIIDEYLSQRSFILRTLELIEFMKNAELPTDERISLIDDERVLRENLNDLEELCLGRLNQLKRFIDREIRHF